MGCLCRKFETDCEVEWQLIVYFRGAYFISATGHFIISMANSDATFGKVGKKLNPIVEYWSPSIKVFLDGPVIGTSISIIYFAIAYVRRYAAYHEPVGQGVSKSDVAEVQSRSTAVTADSRRDRIQDERSISQTVAHLDDEAKKFTDLGIDILTIVCQNLHGVDVFHLCITSKSIRRILFDSQDTMVRLTASLKINSCYDAGKTGKAPCWGCGIQICEVSTVHEFSDSIYLSQQ